MIECDLLSVWVWLIIVFILPAIVYWLYSKLKTQKTLENKVTHQFNTTQRGHASKSLTKSSGSFTSKSDVSSFPDFDIDVSTHRHNSGSHCGSDNSGTESGSGCGGGGGCD